MDEPAEAIRSRIQARVMPEYGPRVTSYQRRGSGQRCALCDSAIMTDEVECEVYWSRPQELVTLKMHTFCLRAWQQASAERRQQGRESH